MIQSLPERTLTSVSSIVTFQEVEERRVVVQVDTRLRPALSKNRKIDPHPGSAVSFGERGP